MELILLQIGKQAILPYNVQDPPYCFHMTLTLILSIDENVI